MKNSFINVRFEHTEKSETHNFRADKSQSLLSKNIEKYKKKFLNILSIFSYQENKKIMEINYATAKDLKNNGDKLKNYRQLKEQIRQEHEEVYYKENKSKLKAKSKSFQEGILTFSTDILFKFQIDENIKIEINEEIYNLTELEKLFTETEEQFLKLQRKNKNIDKTKIENLDNVNVIEELRLEKLIEDINDSIKYNFDIKKFNERGRNAVRKIAEEYNLRILYTTLHLDEKTPHFHFEFENFLRDKNGKIKNKGQAVFKKINRYLKKDDLKDDKYYIKNIGTRVQDIAAEVFKDKNILRGIKKELKIDNNHLHITKKNFWANEIKHKEELHNTLKEQNNKLQQDNNNIEASNKQELAEYKQTLAQAKKDAEIVHINELKENLTVLIENKKELIDIFKEMRAFISKNKDLDIDIKKILYSTFSENQKMLREDVKKLREVKNYENEQELLQRKIKNILNKHNGVISFDKNGANKEILNLINKYTEFDIQYNQMVDLNNKNKELEAQITAKDKEIEDLKFDNKSLNLRLDRAISLETQIIAKDKEIEELKLQQEQDKQELETQITAKDKEIEDLKLQQEQDKQDYLNYISTLNNKNVLEIETEFLLYKMVNIEIEAPDFSKYTDKKVEYETVLDENGFPIQRIKQT